MLLVMKTSYLLLYRALRGVLLLLPAYASSQESALVNSQAGALPETQAKTQAKTQATEQASGLVTIVWDANAQFRHKASIGAASFIEICGKISAGEQVHWQFHGKMPLDFNVHYHIADEVEYPVQIAASKAAHGRLHAPITQSYCWMWTNSSKAEIGLKVLLSRKSTVAPAR
jgi:hypothetical protein